MPLTYTFDPMDIDQNERLAASMNSVWIVIGQTRRPCFTSADAQATLNICSLLDGLARETVAVGAGYEKLPGGSPGDVKAENPALQGATAALVKASVPTPTQQPAPAEPAKVTLTGILAEARSNGELMDEPGDQHANDAEAARLAAQ